MKILITIIIAIVLIAIVIKLYDLNNPKIQDPSANRKKGHDPRNNYFRDSPEHVDMTGSYIESVWEEIKKK